MKHEKVPKVYVLVLNWNGWRDTIECIESILNSSYQNFETVIIDNDSSDQSVEKIKLWAKEKMFNEKPTKKNAIITEYNYNIKNVEKEFDLLSENKGGKITLIQTGKNLGYAGGNNVGIKYALMKNDADYIWVLNNDTVVNEDTLFEVCNYAMNNRIGICGSTILYYNTNVLQCAGGATYNKLLTYNNYQCKGMDIKDINNSGELKLDYVAGCSMFISIGVVKEIGFLCEDYFLYYEELDYCFRAKEKKISTGWCKNSVLYHKEGASLNSEKKKGKSKTAEYYGNLSTLKFSRKFFREYFAIIFISRFLLKLIKNLSSFRFDLNKQLFKAYYDFMFK